jgi:hypothetical protein
MMIILKDTLLWTGRVYCTVMQENWVIARYLYEIHADSCASHGLPPLPDDRSDTKVHGILKPPQVAHLPFNMTYDTYVTNLNLCYLVYLCYFLYLQNRALLDTLRKLHSTGGTRHIVIFNTLAIGHPNEQRISSWPFALKNLRGANHQDLVYSYARPESRMGPLSYEWIAFGSAKLFCCSR